MERDRGTTVLGLGALSVLVAAATISLGRVFLVGEAMPTLLLGAFGSLAIAAVLRRLPGVVAAIVGELAVAWLVVAIVAPGTLREGLPTLRSGRALLHLLGDAIASGRTTIAPVPATRPFLAAALLAIGAAVVGSHAALVRGRRPLLAIAPLVSLAAFADLALGARPPLVLPLALVAGAVAVVVADGVRRVRSFADATPPVRGARAFAIATRGSRATIAGVAIVALVVPPLLPGADEEPLLDISGAAGQVSRVDPFVSIRAQLELPDRVPLLRVVTDDPATYQRLFALERFDGVTWSADEPAFSAPLDSPAFLDYARVLDPAPIIRQRIEIVGGIASGGWLPAPYPARAVTFPTGRLTVEFRTGALQLTVPLVTGDRFEVEALRAVPRPGDLRDRDPRLAGLREAGLVSLPDDLRPALERIAERWTQGAVTPYDRIIAIQEHLLDGTFRYSLDVPEPGDRREVLRFLTRTKTGFCQQFATAMAALVRALGYPARVAVGFREGNRVGDAYVITNQDAHSWVEVPFPGYGWLPFEPTPGRPNPIGSIGSYLDPNEGGAEAEGTGTGATAASPPPRTCVLADGTELPAQLCRAEPDRIDPEGAEGGRPIPEEPVGAPIRDIPIGPIAAGLGVLVLLAVPLARRLLRRRRIARARTSRERALAALAFVDAVGRDLGAGRERSETVREFAERLVGAHPDLVEDVGTLMTVVDRAAYGGDAPTDADASRAVAAARGAAATLARDAGVVRRLVGAYRVGG